MTIPTHPFGYVAQFGEASCAAMIPLARLGMIRLFPEADFTADEVEYCLLSLQQTLPLHAAQLVSLAYKPSNGRQPMCNCASWSICSSCHSSARDILHTLKNLEQSAFR